MIPEDLSTCFQNFEKFIAEQREFYNHHLKNNCVHNWSDNFWHIGRKGTGWLQCNGEQVLNFARIGKIKGVENSPIPIDDLAYRDFMKALLVAKYRRNGGSISSAQAVKIVIMLKRWYAGLLHFKKTHPIYLDTKVLEHAMSALSVAHLKNKEGLPDHKGLCVSLQKMVNVLCFTQTKLNYVSDGLYINARNLTAKAYESFQNNNRPAFGTIDIEGEEYLISIDTFINIIELMHRVKSDGERLALNFLLLLIVTGFRSVEVCNLRFDSLVKRKINNPELVARFRKKGMATYFLGIRYHGVKGVGERIHWVEPLAIPLIEMIYQNVLHITKPMREILLDLRSQKFQSYIPSSVGLFLDEYLDRDTVINNFFETKSAESRGMGAARDNIRKVLKNKGVPEATEKMLKYGDVFYRLKDIETLIENEFMTSGCNKFNPCTHQWQDAGKSYAIKHEELLFLHLKGSIAMKRQLICKTIPIPFTNKIMNDFLGNSKNTSVFQKYNLVESDGKISRLRTHIPRHNINTFLAIAGIEDHLQAMLMGRLDIQQNKHYQHLTESLLTKTMPIANTSVQYNKVDNVAISTNLSILEYVTPQEIVKRTGCVVLNPALNLETNLKTNLGTFDGKDDFQSCLQRDAEILSDIMTSGQMALDELSEGLELDGMDITDSHVQPLPIGFCAKELTNWGCIYRFKCQSGEKCRHFLLTGRLDEYVKLPIKQSQLDKEIQSLIDLQKTTSGYDKALTKLCEARNQIDRLTDNLSDRLQNQQVVNLNNIIDSTTSFKTLAQLFAIEQHKLQE